MKYFSVFGITFLILSQVSFGADASVCASISKVRGEFCEGLDFGWNFSECKGWDASNTKQEKKCNGMSATLSITHGEEIITAEIKKDVTKRNVWLLQGDYGYTGAKAVAPEVAVAVAAITAVATQSAPVAAVNLAEVMKSVAEIPKTQEVVVAVKNDVAPTAVVSEPVVALQEAAVSASPKELEVVAAETKDAPRAIAAEAAATDAVEAQEPEFGLSQDWGGGRKSLFNHGFQVGASIANQSMIISKTGLATMHDHALRADLEFDFDFDKLLRASGLSASVHIIGLKGTAPTTTRVFDVQGVSRMESGGTESNGTTPKAINTVHLYEAFLQESLMNGQIAAKLGILDLNSDFYFLNSARMFLNGGFRMGKEITQQSLSFFPLTTYGAVINVQSADGFYMQSAVYDGAATNGAPEQQFGVNLSFHPKQQGWFMIAETGYAKGLFSLTGKYAAGFWSSPSASTTGFYLMAEQALCKKFSLFAKWGVTNSENVTNEFGSSISAGALWLNPFPLGESSQFGLGMTLVKHGKEFTESNLANVDPATYLSETAIELAYRVELVKGLVLQPDVQYIMNVGGAKNAAGSSQSAIVTSLYAMISL